MPNKKYCCSSLQKNIENEDLLIKQRAPNLPLHTTTPHDDVARRRTYREHRMADYATKANDFMQKANKKLNVRVQPSLTLPRFVLVWFFFFSFFSLPRVVRRGVFSALLSSRYLSKKSAKSKEGALCPREIARVCVLCVCVVSARCPFRRRLPTHGASSHSRVRAPRTGRNKTHGILASVHER